MTQAKKPSKHRRENDAGGESSEKKPYEKPRVTFREPLEGVAAICNPPGKGAPPCEFASS